MRVGSINSSIITDSANVVTTKTSQTATRIATNPSAVKKALQVATKIIAGLDLYATGTIRDRQVTDAMKGTIDMIEFYGSFRNIIYWINPFSRETFDETAFLESLKMSMTSPIKEKKSQERNAKRAEKVFKEVTQEKVFNSKSEVREAVIKSLEHHGYKHDSAEYIANTITIQQKERPITQLFSTACFTTADLMGNALTLKRWGIIDLSDYAAQVGNQSRVLAFVMKYSIGSVIGTIASAGLIISVGDATYRVVIHAYKQYKSSDTAEREHAYQELRKAMFDMVSTGLDLANVGVPLLFSLNPPVLVGMAIVAKGVGLICILAK